MSLHPMPKKDIIEIYQCWQKSDKAISANNIPGYFPRIADEYYWKGISSRLLEAPIYVYTQKYDFSSLISAQKNIFFDTIGYRALNTKISQKLFKDTCNEKIEHAVNIIIDADDEKCVNKVSKIFSNNLSKIKLIFSTQNIFLIQKLKQALSSVTCTFCSNKSTYEILCNQDTFANILHLFEKSFLSKTINPADIFEKFQTSLALHNLPLPLSYQDVIFHIEKKTKPSDIIKIIAEDTRLCLLHNFLVNCKQETSLESLLIKIAQYLCGSLSHLDSNLYKAAKADHTSFLDVTPLPFSSEEEASTYYTFRGEEIYYLGMQPAENVLKIHILSCFQMVIFQLVFALLMQRR